MARFPVYDINVGGVDVTNAFSPLLIALTVRETPGGKADTLEIELDDSYGQIVLPQPGADVEASLGWSDTGAMLVFTGVVGDVGSGKGKVLAEGHDEKKLTPRSRVSGAHPGGQSGEKSAGDRHKGRTLTITATSADMRGGAKQHLEKHADNTNFQSAASSFAQDAGLSVQVSGSLASIQRDYWWIGNESFLEWGARIAAELGATFKVFGNQAVFVPRSSGMSASGQPLVPIDAIWGENLISWSISPILSRPNYAEFGSRWYDLNAAQWNRQAAPSADAEGVTAKHTGNFKASNQDQATNRANSSKDEGNRDRGGGDSVTIEGEPMAQAEAECNVVGVRPGVDGTYIIAEVMHHLTRGQSFTTDLALKQPTGGAGTDSR